MYSRYFPIIVIPIIVLLFDQTSKYMIDTHMGLYESREILRHFFHITYIRNPGAAFGFLADGSHSTTRYFFMAATLLAIGVILTIYHRNEVQGVTLRFSLSLILGGALGNFIDRLRFGEVIDFLDVHWYQYHWPAFNVADASISLGMGLFIWHILRKRENH
ncbi:MAG: signal peptidase II [Candidatus Tectomicrobia bacterium]|nr:signal peptidase II [Candidatus Tectomicrobia bacterium]